MTGLQQVIRRVLRDNARLAIALEELADHDDLYLAGMTSMASVNVMLALEAALDTEFPERMLRKATFSSISSIRAALDEIGEARQ